MIIALARSASTQRCVGRSGCHSQAQGALAEGSCHAGRWGWRRRHPANPKRPTTSRLRAMHAANPSNTAHAGLQGSPTASCTRGAGAGPAGIACLLVQHSYSARRVPPTSNQPPLTQVPTIWLVLSLTASSRYLPAWPTCSWSSGLAPVHPCWLAAPVRHAAGLGSDPPPIGALRAA